MPKLSRGADFALALACVGVVAAGYHGSRRQPVSLPPEPLAGAGPSPLERAIDAMRTENLETIRAEAKRLRAEGHTDIANRMVVAADLLEKMKKAPPQQWPVTADPVTDPWLLNAPPLSAEDLQIAEWLRAEDKGAPPFTTADLYPDRQLRRKLTPHERWVLAPYFPVAQDLDAELVFEKPPGVPDDALRNLHAYTMGETGAVVVYFPNGPQSMLNRWWTAILAHELFHGVQIRLGMSPQQATDSLIKWGYQLSPLEVQARFYQRTVYMDLAKRAAAYFAARARR